MGNLNTVYVFIVPEVLFVGIDGGVSNTYGPVAHRGHLMTHLAYKDVVYRPQLVRQTIFAVMP
jgi:hypothetical protein